MKAKIHIMKKIVSTLLLGIIAIAVCAQKLPNVQTTGVRAPATVKIDGKASEWDGQMQAYNKNTELYYTLANDDNNLYLIVQVVNPRIIQKVLDTGINFTINLTGKKGYKEKENISITFPRLKTGYVADILRKAGDKSHWSALTPGAMLMVGADVLTRTDSTVNLANKRLAEQANTITIHGVNTIPDTLISVYNEYGIKAAAAFNNAGNYIFELALPLKYFGKPVSDLQKFTYSIKLNAIDADGYFVDRATKVNMPFDSDILSETKFWGEYTLAKK